jgi:hypothetical protein
VVVKTEGNRFKRHKGLDNRLNIGGQERGTKEMKRVARKVGGKKNR